VRVRRYLLLTWSIAAALALGAQNVPSTAPAKPPTSEPFSAIALDPVCPTVAYGSAVSTQQIRVSYFPSSSRAKLKDPQSLTLELVVNGANWADNTLIVPFTRKDSHWEATVPGKPFYNIFYVKDEKAGQMDDNGGRYWEIEYCNPDGGLTELGAMLLAESYAGEQWPVAGGQWPLGIKRKKDYATAVSILEAAIGRQGAADLYMWAQAIERLWEYQAQRDGGDAEAYAKVAQRIEQFLSAHQQEANVPVWTIGNFLSEFQDKLPADSVERMVQALEARDPHSEVRAQLLYRRSLRERDPAKRQALQDELLAKYPESSQAMGVWRNKLPAAIAKGDVPGAEAAFASWRKFFDSKRVVDPTAPDAYLSLVQLYADKGVKLQEALKLIDEAESMAPAVMSQSNRNSFDQRFVQARMRVYLSLQQPALALAQARKVSLLAQTAADYSLLGRVYAAAGEKDKAVDAYFQAALLPDYDLSCGEQAEQFYLSNHLGDRAQFAGELHKRRAVRFAAANYVPALVDRPAPALEFTTLAGEKFEEAALRSKLVVLNFWSPG
jgi:tetratricopeptide (TPR) repeat protein